jgi:hypothetical protein
VVEIPFEEETGLRFFLKVFCVAGLAVDVRGGDELRDIDEHLQGLGMLRSTS